MVTDPIANMLTSIRNAQAARKTNVRVPYSRLKADVADILRKAGYLGPVAVAEGDAQKLLEITLLYDADGRPRLRGLRRVSKPGRRWYVRKAEIPRVLSGAGVAVLSTPKGLLTDADARKHGVGGEVLCEIA